MLRNVEIKCRIKDFDKTSEIARNLCKSNSVVLYQEDTFFNSSVGRLKLRDFKDASDAQLIFYDRPDTPNLKTSNYSICFVKNAEQTIEVLKSALGIKGVVKKTRHLYLYGQTRIHLDRVEGLGNFLELEVVLKPDQTVEEGEEIARNLMQKLDISQENLIKGAYLDELIIK